MWNGIVAMALPKQDGKKNCNWFVAMPLPKQGVKKKIWNCESEWNSAMPLPQFHSTLFFFLNDMCTQF